MLITNKSFMKFWIPCLEVCIKANRALNMHAGFTRLYLFSFTYTLKLELPNASGSIVLIGLSDNILQI